MSSSRPNRWRSRAALLVLPLLVGLAAGAPAALAAPPLVAVPLGPAGEQVRLVVRVPGGPVPPEAFSAAVDGVPRPVTAEPVLSDRLAVAFVVDTSDAAALPSALAGAANLVLAAPPSVHGTVVADGTPPGVVVPWPASAPQILRGLSDMRPGGPRDTAAALDLAAAGLPVDTGGARLVVLYTGAPDAGGEPAAAIAERLRSAGVLLAVVGAGAPPFWTAAADATGGIAVGATPTDVLAPSEEVVSELGGRYVLTLPAPAGLPATVEVRVETGAGSLVTEVVVPATAPQPAVAGSDPAPVIALLAGAVLAAALAVVARRRGRAGVPAPDVTSGVGRRDRVRGIPARLEVPVDRETLQGEMAAALRGGAPVWLAPQADRVGLGTTSALVDFAHRHAGRYDIAWWVPALDPDLVPDRLAELAEAIGLTTGAEPADRAVATLLDALARRGRWLLIFDDAPGPRELGRYLPGGTGHVLVASTDPGWGELAVRVTVPAFTRAESVRLLRAGRPELPPGHADGIAYAVGDVPQAVAHASALLADPDTDVGALHRLLPRPVDRSDAEVARALGTVLVDRLAPEPGALALLTLAAWLAPAALPLSLVAEHRHVLPEPLRSVPSRSALDEYAAALRRRGLARETADGFLLHPQTTRLLVCRTGRANAHDGGWAAAAIRLLRAAAPALPATDPAGWPTWRALLPHVLAATDPARPLDHVADEVSWLLAGAGGYLAASGRPDAAQALLDDAHALRPD